jgi:hypothetical protein
MTSENELTAKTREQLRSVRGVLLSLHKTLLDHERKAYERDQGKISNSYEFLNLVMSDPWFAWLRRLSELIVEMDELLADRKSPQETTGLALIRQSAMLLTPVESGDEFQRKYFVAMQQSPEVVLAHAEFAKVLGPARLTKEVH